MDIIDIIEKKRYGQELSSDEISYFVKGYTNDEIYVPLIMIKTKK